MKINTLIISHNPDDGSCRNLETLYYTMLFSYFPNLRMIGVRQGFYQTVRSKLSKKLTNLEYDKINIFTWKYNKANKICPKYV